MCIYLTLPVHNVHNAYMCKLRKELPPVNLAAVTCDSCSGMTGKLVPGSIIVCGMGSSTAQGVKITGVCRSPPLPDEVGRRRLAALSGLRHSAARRQFFFGSYCNIDYDDVIKWKHFLHYWPSFAGNLPVTSQWRGALVFSLICALNNRLSKQSWGWWCETPSRSLWSHCNGLWNIFGTSHIVGIKNTLPNIDIQYDKSCRHPDAGFQIYSNLIIIHMNQYATINSNSLCPFAKVMDDVGESGHTLDSSEYIHHLW